MEAWIDLSHPIHSSMPVYPGTETPEVEHPFTISSHGFREARIHMVSHTGTHIDAPSHMIEQGKNLNDYPLEYFGGQAFMLTVADRKEIGISEFSGIISSTLKDRWLILHTGWSKFWGTDRYFEGFPVLSREAADFLSISGIKGIGMDCISIDPVGDTLFYNHKVLLGQGILLVENLTGLEKIKKQSFFFLALPLPLRQADGAPVRAIALPEKRF